jgi:hypothetical protein
MRKKWEERQEKGSMNSDGQQQEKKVRLRTSDPCTSKQHDKCNTKNRTADHDIVLPISQTSTPPLRYIPQHLAHVCTKEDNIFVDSQGELS